MNRDTSTLEELVERSRSGDRRAFEEIVCCVGERVRAVFTFDRSFDQFSGPLFIDLLTADKDPLDPEAEPLAVFELSTEARRIPAEIGDGGGGAGCDDDDDD